MLENKFKQKLKKKIQDLLPGSLVLHLDPTDIQGIPDMLILYGNRWAALEGKKEASASHRPNQDYYVEQMNNMSFASFIYPENEEEVLNDMARSLKGST
jgi:hypothetical protein